MCRARGWSFTAVLVELRRKSDLLERQPASRVVINCLATLGLGEPVWCGLNCVHESPFRTYYLRSLVGTDFKTKSLIPLFLILQDTSMDDPEL